MVNNQKRLNATFSALSDPTRRAILARLATGETTVTELAAPFKISLPGISKHLKVLEEAGLLARRKDGRIHRCRLAADPLKAASQWIAYYQRFWEEQFDSLERYLEKTKDTTEESSWNRKAHRSHRSNSEGPSKRPGKRSSRRGSNRKR